MSSSECRTCGATVAAEARFCSECGSPVPEPDGVEARVRRYWSAPDLGLLAGIVLAGAGVVLVGAQAWLWAAVALGLAALVFLLRWEAGRRRTGSGAAGSDGDEAGDGYQQRYRSEWPTHDSHLQHGLQFP